VKNITEAGETVIQHSADATHVELRECSDTVRRLQLRFQRRPLAFSFLPTI
jgi:hypothetical protein